jgi:ribosomal protein S18 acetylase RimI-like enzyme
MGLQTAMSTLRWRPAMPDDQALQLQIYAGTRADELAQVPWAEAQRLQFVTMQHQAQQQHYASRFPQSLCQIIEVLAGQAWHPVGRLWVDQRAQGLHVLDISLLPHARGQGLGGQCLRQVQDQAAGQGLAVSIYVELHNPARRLYERLGFKADGEPEGLHQHMVWHARQTTATESTLQEDKQPC